MHPRVVACILLLSLRFSKHPSWYGGSANDLTFLHFFNFAASKGGFYWNVNPNPSKKKKNETTDAYPLFSFPPMKHNMEKYIFAYANFFPSSMRSIRKKKPLCSLPVLIEEEKWIISSLRDILGSPVPLIYAICDLFDCASMHYILIIFILIKSLTLCYPCRL